MYTIVKIYDETGKASFETEEYPPDGVVGANIEIRDITGPKDCEHDNFVILNPLEAKQLHAALGGFLAEYLEDKTLN